MSDLISNLALEIRDFIKFKNSLGIEYKTGLYYLKQLDKYNYEHGNYDDFKKDITENLAMQHANKSTTGDRSWISPKIGRAHV